MKMEHSDPKWWVLPHLSVCHFVRFWCQDENCQEALSLWFWQNKNLNKPESLSTALCLNMSNYILPLCMAFYSCGIRVVLFTFSLSESLPKGHQPGNFPRISPWQHSEGRHGSCTPPSRRKLPTPHKQDQESPGLSSRGSSPCPRPRHRSNLSRHSSTSDLGTPDVIIEELFDERQERGVCVCERLSLESLFT